MSRYQLPSLLLAVAALTGCMNAPSGSGESSGGGDSATHATNSDVTADGGGAQTVNGSIHVPAGQKTGSVQTVNGAIHIDDNATLAEADTVNGAIGVGPHASADTLKTVNGAITLEDGAHIAHGVTSVNGKLVLRNGADVSGPLENVSGSIELTDAHVGGGISTVNGDIDVGPDSHVEGGILVRKPSSGFFSWGVTRKPRIVIGPGAVVNGNLRFEREVELYVSDKATIGAVSGATPIRFSGSAPPG